jgi:hypothetical protein|tara:strand:+ start:16089 stop:16256 length:168 start_codon:yes stop_codon:yes gene_type:complete
MVVANVRAQGIRDRGRVWKVDAERRHRDRGIEAAMLKCGYTQKRRRRKERVVEGC